MVINNYKSFTNASFRKLYARLADDVQRQAKAQYQLFKDNPNHPSLDFKQLQGNAGLCPARVNDHYRVVGTYGPEIIWFWIGAKNEARKLF